DLQLSSLEVHLNLHRGDPGRSMVMISKLLADGLSAVHILTYRAHAVSRDNTPRHIREREARAATVHHAVLDAPLVYAAP
ncbi:MAG: hypothetical protein HW416_2339, partial [Chloroflexi bacterium]|nr:hypothetical protein [Chloroflexota bacterium]